MDNKISCSTVYPDSSSDVKDQEPESEQNRKTRLDAMERIVFPSPTNIYPESILAYEKVNQRGLLCLLNHTFLSLLQLLASLSKFKTIEHATSITYVGALPSSIITQEDQKPLLHQISSNLQSLFTTLAGKIETLCIQARYFKTVMKHSTDVFVCKQWNKSFAALKQVSQEMYHLWWFIQKEQVFRHSDLMRKQKHEEEEKQKSLKLSFLLQPSPLSPSSSSSSSPSSSLEQETELLTLDDRLRHQINRIKQEKGSSLNEHEKQYQIQSLAQKGTQSFTFEGDAFQPLFQAYLPWTLHCMALFQQAKQKEGALKQEQEPHTSTGTQPTSSSTIAQFHESFPFILDHITSLLERLCMVVNISNTEYLVNHAKFVDKAQQMYRHLLPVDLVLFHLVILNHEIVSIEMNSLPVLYTYNTMNKTT